MLQSAHTEKTSLPISTAGVSNILVAADPEAWIYVHEIIGSLNVAGGVDIYAGTRLLATFPNLAAKQGLTENDEPGNDNNPRFKCRPGEALILTVTGGGVFSGSLDYSKSY